MRVLLLSLLSLASACANHRYFAPREHCNGHGPDGQPAAVYALQGEGAEGEVRIWSSGSSRRDGAGDDGTEIHLGFELENTGAQPLQLDVASLRLDAVCAADQGQGPLRASRLTGNPEAAPGSTARVDAWFEPGPGIAPEQVDAFAARFVVRCAALVVCNQLTPFEPLPDYAYPYYRDPWLWGGYGYSIGWYGPYWRRCH